MSDINRYIPAHNEHIGAHLVDNVEENMSLIKKAFKFLRRFKPTSKYVIKGLTPRGAPTFDPITGAMTTSEAHPDAYNAIMRTPTGEVIEPQLGDTAETICEKMSLAATDHEFRRVIVHPIVAPLRRDVLELIESYEGQIKYPMFEYRAANITNNDDLDARTIIYKYAAQSHPCKPI